MAGLCGLHNLCNAKLSNSHEAGRTVAASWIIFGGEPGPLSAANARSMGGQRQSFSVRINQGGI